MRDNVVEMPDHLERRALRIEAALAKQDDANARTDDANKDWKAATLELAIELAGTKTDLRNNNQAFGKWCDERFGDNRLSHQDRAILVRWGNDLEGTRALLAKTDSRSIQGIDRRLTSASKTPRSTTAKRGTAEASIRVHKAIHGAYPTVIQATQETGLSRIVIEPALAAVKAEDSIAPAEIRFTKAQDSHVEAMLRIRLKNLEAEFNERVRLRVLQENKDYLKGLEELETKAREQLDLYQSLTNRHQPIFTDTEFTVILTCLHPDNSASKEKRDIAFKAFNAMKFQLTGKK